MNLTVTIQFDDGTPIDAGVNLQLLSSGQVVSTATTDTGSVTFTISDPPDLTNPAINLATQQTPPKVEDEKDRAVS